MSAFYDRFERDEIRKTNEHIPVYAHYRLTIPHDAKQKIIEELEMLGVSRETLFPGLDEGGGYNATLSEMEWQAIVKRMST